MLREKSARRLHRPAFSVTTALLVAYFALSVEPGRIVSNTNELHRSLAASQWLPGQLEATDVQGAGGRSRADLVGGVMAFGLFGFLLALSARFNGRDRRAALESSVGQSALLAVVYQLIQVFLVNRGVDGAGLVLEFLAASAGAFVAIHVVDEPSGSAWVRRPEQLLSPVLFVPIFYAQVGYWLVRAFDGAGLSEAGSVQWVPFAGWSGRPMAEAAMAILRTITLSGLLASTAVILCARCRGLARWFLAGHAVLIVSLACELIGFHRGASGFDVTNPILALTGVAAAYAASKLFHRFSHDARPFVLTV